jgi:2-iminobutanoate/2-iminopropanoate deaminase
MSKKQVILAKPGSPYSTAIKANGFLFISGNVSVGPDGKSVTGDIKVQTEQVLQNLRRIVESQGASLDDVVKANVYLTDAQDFAGMNEVYRSFFPSEPPTRTTVGVKQLTRPEFIVEIDLIVAL